MFGTQKYKGIKIRFWKETHFEKLYTPVWTSSSMSAIYTLSFPWLLVVRFYLKKKNQVDMLVH